MLGQLELALKREREPEEYRRAIAIAIRGKSFEWHRRDAALPGTTRRRGQIASHEVAELWKSSRPLADYWSGHPRCGDISLEATGDSSVHTRPALLGQAIHNILENAIKYSEREQRSKSGWAGPRRESRSRSETKGGASP